MATPTWLNPKFSDLEACLALTDQVAITGGGEASDEDVAKMLGVSLTSSYFTLKLNSVRAYGLVEYRAGRVKVTDLGKKVTVPADAAKWEAAILSAMFNFPMFKRLTERYHGKNQPDKRSIETLLQAEEKAKSHAPEWAECFLQSANYAGVFKPITPLETGRSHGEKGPQTVVLPGSDVEDRGNEDEWLQYAVVVPKGKARLIVPPDLSHHAWEKLTKLLEAIEPEQQGVEKH